MGKLAGRVFIPLQRYRAAVLPFDVLKEQLPSNSINPVSGFG